MKYTFKEIIAIVLYKIGVKPKCTHFIDEETVSYGYGKLDGWMGLWQYQIPFNVKSEKLDYYVKN
jgi:hypothetical protein